MKMHKLPCVYVLACNDFKYLKIGMTKNLKQRMSNLQSGCPFDLFLFLTIRTNQPREVETYLHNELSRFRVRGEWYSLNDEQLLFLEKFSRNRNLETRKGANHALL